MKFMKMDITKPPFVLPQSLPNSKKVNGILKESYELQKKVGLSNACGIVNIILQKGLDAVGIKSEVIHGSLKGPGIRVPHVWLTIHGHIVDNTYLDLPASISAEDMTHHYQLENYEDIVPSESSENIFLGDEDTRKMGIEVCSLKLFKWQLENKDMCITICFNKGHIKRYIEQFAEFLNTEYSVTNFSAFSTNDICWSCGDDGVTLKTCKKCKRAKYCNKKCQKTDWKKIHREVCFPPETF